MEEPRGRKRCKSRGLTDAVGEARRCQGNLLERKSRKRMK